MQWPRMACYNGPDHPWAFVLDEAARWNDLVVGLRPMSCGAKGVLARCLVSAARVTTAKASGEGWRLRLRPNIQSAQLRHFHLRQQLLPTQPDPIASSLPILALFLSLQHHLPHGTP